MKWRKIFAGSVLAIFVTVLGWTGIASAHSFHTGDNITLNQSQAIQETVFAAGRTVDISNEIFGDVFVAGQNVTVSGTIHGDVIAAGQNVHVTGKIDGDIRLAGQTITLSAEVDGNATIAGQSFTMDSNTKIAGDLTVGSADAVLNGSIGRDLAFGSESAIITGAVGRNIKGTVNNLKLASGAQVAGNIEYTSRNDLVRDSGAQVAGQVTRSEPKESQSQPKRGAVFGFGVGWFIYWFLAMLLTAMVIALLFPRMLQVVTNRALPTPWKSLLVGFLASLVFPFALVLLAVTIVGLPLAFLLGFMWVAALLLSGPLFGYYIGRLVMPDSRHALVIMLVGASILLVLYFVPFVGVLAMIAATWVGIGMLLLEVFSRTPKPEYNVGEAVAVKRTRK